MSIHLSPGTESPGWNAWFNSLGVLHFPGEESPSLAQPVNCTMDRVDQTAQQVVGSISVAIHPEGIENPPLNPNSQSDGSEAVGPVQHSDGERRPNLPDHTLKNYLINQLYVFLFPHEANAKLNPVTRLERIFDAVHLLKKEETQLRHENQQLRTQHQAIMAQLIKRRAELQRRAESQRSSKRGRDSDESPGPSKEIRPSIDK